MNASSGAVNIELVLVDLSSKHTIESSERSSNEEVSQLIRNTVDLCGAQSLADVKGKNLHHNGITSSIINKPDGSNARLCDSLLRYLKAADKYLNFTSTLLKSWFYWHHAESTLPTRCFPMKDDRTHTPIVTLPKSQHGKPFIPSIDHQNTLLSTHHDKHRYKNDCADNLPKPTSVFNVSHQYPYVGLAYIFETIDEIGSTTKINEPANSIKMDRSSASCKKWMSFRNMIQTRIKKSSTGPTHLLGCDIVTLSSYNDMNKIYKSKRDYISVFQSSFTRWEWERIMNTGKDGDEDTPKLKEFYLRWSMKEAYTKALGLGMTIEFNSFECHLLPIDDTTSESSPSKVASSWDIILDQVNSIESQPDISVLKICSKASKYQCSFQHASTCQKAVHVSSLVKNMRDGANKTDLIDFLFVPLPSIEKTMEAERFVGLVCLCVITQDQQKVNQATWRQGEAMETSSSYLSRFHVNIVKKDLEELISFHKECRAS